MAARSTRSISGPIIYGSISVTLALALMVGWIYVILQNQELTQRWVGNLWLLVAGIASFATIMTVLVLFSVFLARQILEIRRQTTFVDSVTHELRSPLASLRLCLETLERPGLEPEQEARLREMMVEDVERLSAFIDDILEANRTEHGREGHSITTVDLPVLLERCIASVSKRHKADPSIFTLDVAPDMQIDSDPAALELVFKNLLDNAVKYSDPPATVHVSAKESDQGVIIEVTDRGVGIPRRAIKRIFERFYRVDDEAVRSRRGTGLGLFVVKALVRNLGGKLRAHSDGPGKGTRMTIQLPNLRRDAMAVEALTDKAYG